MTEGSKAVPLRRGWTTGACATAAARAAFVALCREGPPPNPITIFLPSGQRVDFAVDAVERGDGFASAGVVKDAGDDPDVTHGATIVAKVRRNRPSAGVSFGAGPGVGTVTRPGLLLAVGEPAINPVPRAMIRENIAEAAHELGALPDVSIELSIPGGEEIARRTLNGRLGIVGGLSILGTTGVVVPYSCSAWIDAIHRGVDVARACGARHVAAATGSVSEGAVRRLYDLPEEALIEMGDFVGALLKYLRAHPVQKLTLAGGFAKMTKLAQGALDLHSARSTLDLSALARLAASAGADPALAGSLAGANSALEALQLASRAGVDLASQVADRALETAIRALAAPQIELELIVFDREGKLLARATQ
ncbi:cobalt-precorrin-5B (C(1))-methyltransferase [Methylocystis bryophila]|uniref:Cobalt-precorrin-5B C(1)-methyltransferase n=1 Tax=Methylocystis bryophila TaxID=655015 RepID=A0A1W6MSR3_9HYPH|nr:cobalt-precorrin-5B (C(1))-methyltransferase [Methylocystis bryophila]ARN80595.1 cobalt-precorrin-5B (C(1))-methyltransferase [Methylocystis bryophila]BDV40648.1 cobalt-precorrin-5B C(1)-methyltransferase [Methylocystis bryophila]